MTDYRGGGITNMRIRQSEKLIESIRKETENVKKSIEENQVSITEVLYIYPLNIMNPIVLVS